jgi:hypothetical protein
MHPSFQLMLAMAILTPVLPEPVRAPGGVVYLATYMSAARRSASVSGAAQRMAEVAIVTIRAVLRRKVRHAGCYKFLTCCYCRM